MTFFLRLYRLILVIIWFIIIGTYALTNFIGGWGAIKRASLVTRIWARGIVKIINIKVNVIGDISDFKGGLIISNHLGFLDIIVLASIFPVRFSPKLEIAFWPLLGQYVALGRPIWVNRNSRQKSKKVLQQFRDTISHNISLVVYPEGTSSDGIGDLLPFKSTPFEAAIEKNQPILPVLIHYENPGVPWYGDMTLVPHVWRIVGMREIKVDLNIMKPGYADGRNRKELAADYYELMNEKYNRIYNQYNNSSC